jgi:hypothetical protein
MPANSYKLPSVVRNHTNSLRAGHLTCNQSGVKGPTLELGDVLPLKVKGRRVAEGDRWVRPPTTQQCGQLVAEGGVDVLREPGQNLAPGRRKVRLRGQPAQISEL